MKKIFLLLLSIQLVIQVTGCRGPETNSSENKTAAKKTAVPADEAKGREFLKAFLTSMQKKDKKGAYAASNINSQLVEESRSLIVNQPITKPSQQKIFEAENILRISGTTDLYLKKLPAILLEKATIEVINSKKWDSKSPTILLHEVKVTFPDKKEAISDKTGGVIKEFILRFNQIQYMANGQPIQEFLIEDRDFENLINRKLDVKAYF